ncbi:MAG: DUF4974 domain-containing protein [Bacteroidales bacterium]|nr:DUF4974 domain-containing protein [Bacteroidales bacterium]
MDNSNRIHISDEEILFSSVSREELASYGSTTAFTHFLDRVDRSKRRKRRFVYGLSSFAALSLLAIVSVLSFRAGRSDIESKMADIKIEAPSGSRSKMTLPDGTVVWLNAGSSLTYSQEFGVNDRQVTLNGEGYFEVTHKETLPFQVCTNNVRVRVLGTKFNLRDYPTDPEAVVSLEEGRVAMSSLVNPSEEKHLKPNQKGAVDKENGTITIEFCESSNYMQWINGRLIFDGEALPVIIEDIERCYNVNITLSNEKLAGLRFYGDFLRQEQTLGEVMNALSTTGKFKYQINGRDIIIY